MFGEIILRKFFGYHDNINIIRDKVHSQIIEYDNIYVNDNTNILLEKFLLYFREREGVRFYTNINLKNLHPEDEKLIQTLSFIHIDKLKLINCNININILKELNINSLDLSESNYLDIGISKFEELKTNIKEIIFDKPCIIIDNGTSYVKAGINGEEHPRSFIPSCVGYQKNRLYMEGKYKRNYFVGSDAKARRGNLNLDYPIQNGVVNNWDDVEYLWGHILTNELTVDPEEHNIILTDSSMSPKESKERMAQIIFGTFNAHGLYIVNKAVLPLYYTGKYTGMVIDSGDGDTQIVPIFDGFPLPHAISRLKLSGEDLTNYMMNQLNDANCSSISDRKELFKTIKEKACYVALDFEEELKSVKPYVYELPDNIHISVKEERISCPEALFKPDIVGKEGSGIAQLCNDSIQKCDIDIRKELYNCIVLSGGNSMFNGLSERLTKEIKTLSPESMKEEVKVFAPPERKFLTWIGGSILSSSPLFKSMYITKSEYEDYGSYIVHRKCF